LLIIYDLGLGRIGMGKRLVILVLAFFASTVVFGAGTAREALLRDGFVLRGVDGKLVGPDSNDVWFFELSSDVNDYRAVVKAGARLELLPSSALEKMIADAKVRPAATYRLWNGRVTKYHGRNYIFPNYFLPLRKAKKPPSETSPPPAQGQGKPTDASSEKDREPAAEVDEPNDTLAIPPEIMKKLRARRQAIEAGGRRIVDSNAVPIEEPQPTDEKRQLLNAKLYTLSADSMLIDRTALLAGHPDGRLAFILDAFGRNVRQVSLRLLPCEALELTELRQSVIPDPVRFKIGGIMTKYKGQDYLLLQKAIPAYSHGNFGR
jgi:hypothetical protein